MRSAKTLLKMNDKVKQQLPNWFKGEVYELGDEVRNPFSGETVLLDAAELSMYDFLKGAEHTLILMSEKGESDDQLVKDFDKGRDWFRENNIEAYMTLLD